MVITRLGDLTTIFPCKQQELQNLFRATKKTHDFRNLLPSVHKYVLCEIPSPFHTAVGCTRIQDHPRHWYKNLLQTNRKPGGAS
jgi:hypothetical protein